MGPIGRAGIYPFSAMKTEEIEPEVGRARSRLILVLRMAVSAAMLAVLISRVPREELSNLWQDWDRTRITWLLIALGLTAGSVLLAALRWRQVLRALGLTVPTHRLLSLHLAGLFVSNFLPSTIGGDVLRVRRLSRQTEDPPAAFASVIIERLTGWLVLPMLTITGLLVNPSLLRLGAASSTALILVGTTLVLVLTVVYIAEHDRVGRRLQGSGAIRRQLAAVHLGLSHLRDHPHDLRRLVGIGISYQTTLVVATAMAGRAVGIDLGPTAWLAFAPAVLIAQVFPLSVGGLGIREGALVLFLGPLGVTNAEAIALGLLIYAINLLVSLAGAPSFAMGHRRYERVGAAR